MNYVTRDIPKEVDALVTELFPGNVPGKKILGRSGLVQTWKRSLVLIGSLSAIDADLAIDVFALWQRSLQIAERTKKDEEARSERVILEKYYAELDELREAIQARCSILDIANRLSNVLYYAVRKYALDGDVAKFIAVCDMQCANAGIPRNIAFQCAVAKFGDRAVREEKDIASEYAKMQQVLTNFDEFLKSQKNHP